MDDDLTIQARGAIAAEEEAIHESNVLVDHWIKQNPFCFAVKAYDNDPQSESVILSLHLVQEEAAKALLPNLNRSGGGWYRTDYIVDRVEMKKVPQKVVRELIKTGKHNGRVCLHK